MPAGKAHEGDADVVGDDHRGDQRPLAGERFDVLRIPAPVARRRLPPAPAGRRVAPGARARDDPGGGEPATAGSKNTSEASSDVAPGRHEWWRDTPGHEECPDFSPGLPLLPVERVVSRGHQPGRDGASATDPPHRCGPAPDRRRSPDSVREGKLAGGERSSPPRATCSASV